MGLDDTHAFVHVVRAGGYTAAARVLGVPKSTLSRQVARLEDELGVRLLQRSTRRVGVTEAGQAYFQRCSAAIEAIDDARRAALDAGSAPRGLLRVASGFDLGHTLVVEALVELRARHPEVQVELVLGQGKVDLIADGFDVAIRGGPQLADSTLVARKLAAASIVLAASPAYLARRGTPTTVAELADHDLAFIGPIPGGRLPLHGPRGLEELVLDTVFVANEWTTMRAAAVAGVGITGLLSYHLPLVGERLVRVLPEHAADGGALWAVYPSAKHLTPAVRALVDLLVPRARALMGRLAPL